MPHRCYLYSGNAAGLRGGTWPYAAGPVLEPRISDIETKQTSTNASIGLKAKGALAYFDSQPANKGRRLLSALALSAVSSSVPERLTACSR